MAIKPFAIQGADLTLGGVNLQAGTDGVVIPGITQATNYIVEEVNDTNIDQNVQFVQLSIVVDAATYNALSTSASTAAYASYTVEIDDDFYIDNIEVSSPGSYTQQEKTTNETTDMWAYTGLVDPFTTPFDEADWLQVPFRPKMRAGEIENVGGGGGNGNELVAPNEDAVATLDNNGKLQVAAGNNNVSIEAYSDSGDGYSTAITPDGIVGVWNGLDTWSTGAGPSGFSLIGEADKSFAVMLSANDQSKQWTFNTDGSITFPDNTVQTTAYTGQSGGGSSASGYIYIMANVDGNIVTSTDGITWGSPTPSGMNSISRVAVHNGVIVYIASGDGDGPGNIGLYYSTTIGTVELCTGTDIYVGDGTADIYWNQVRYFDEPNKWVAVGYIHGEPSDSPVVAFSENGADWAVVPADDTFVTGFNPTNLNWRLTNIAWLTETQEFVITSDLSGQDVYGGIFITSNITVPLDGSVHVPIDLNSDDVAPWSVVQFGGPTGYMMLFGTDNEHWYGYSSVVENYGVDTEFWGDVIIDQIGYLPNITEVAYDADGYVAVTNNGQVLTPVFSMGGPGVIVSIPLPFTVTDFSISRANPAVLTYTAPTSDSPESVGLHNGEKIEITGSDQFNGTYYYKESDGTLYTDQVLETALDSSMFDPFVSGGTLTMSQGRYFDAAGTSSNYYYIGNDDEQIFRSSNGTTWTQLADVTGEYFNDFAYGTFTTADTGVGFVQLADGSLQARAASLAVAALSSALTTGKPTWLTVTPRSPDRETLDTHYGFDGSGMWFTGDNEATFNEQPAYPIHTTASFPADATTVVEFDINLVAGEEDWGVCVYPADGIPHWAWDPHPSRIAAVVDCSVGEGPYVQPSIYGLTNIIEGDEAIDVARARFTYNPVAEITIMEVLNSSGKVTSRTQLPGRLAKGQDYRIGFDADWDEAGPNDKSYFSNLSITVGETGVTKTTDFTITGEIKLPSTIKGFVNMSGPWNNGNSDVNFHTVATHNGFAYIGGEEDWDSINHARLDKYSLTTGELVWSRVLGAGRMAAFDISWTGGTYTLDGINNAGVGYKVNEVLYIAGDNFSGGAYPANNATITVTAVDGNGAIGTATIAGTAPSVAASATGATPYGGDARGLVLSVKYDTVNDNLVLLSSQDSILTAQAVVVRINPANGDVVENVTLTDEGDIYPYDVAVHPTTGATAVVGEKYNEYKEFGTLTMLATGNGYFDILKSELDEEHWPGNGISSDPIYNFLISGTGIATTENVDNVNYYPAVAATTRQGTGAEFVITDNGDGTYAEGISITPTGTNYRVGHKIKVLGTSLGGATPANDATLTVSDETGGAIIAYTITGTAAGSSVTPWSGVTGTNVDVGSGLLLNVTVDPITGSITTGVHTAGSNYVVDDVAIIPGATYAHGVTPTHNTEITVVSIGGSGEVTGLATSNIPPTDAIRILVDNVDFTAVGGSWSMKQNLDGEAFVWTPDWNKAIGGGTYDKFQAVVYSKDGASIYAVGSGYYETSYAQSLVVKYATSDGTIEFSKYLNSENTNAYATSVATIGTSDIVVSGYEYRSGLGIDKQFIARMSSSGTILWKKFYGEGNWGWNSLARNSNIEVDSDDNIYVTLTLADDNPSWAHDGFTVTKLDSTGNILWTRCLSGNESSYLGNSNGNRWSSLHGDQLVVAGYTWETSDEQYNGLWASFPTDGFTYLGGEGDFVQMGAFRFGPGRIKDDGDASSDVGGTFTPSVQPPNITAVTDFKRYETRAPDYVFPQHLHKMVDPKHGGLVFGDGTKQTTAGDRIPQIRADNDYYLTANDSGKHIYFRNNSGNVVIPGWWYVNLPVGFTFTIVNYTGNTCYVNLEWWPGEVGTILGAGRNISTPVWGIPDSGSGSMVTLIKLEDGHDYNNQGQAFGPVWMISGPSDIYNAD
jgi:hypothetical protein